MSDMQTIMKLELLPNEILIECFEYLNAIDIYYSFDSLNSRFYNLIRNIPLHLNVKDIENSKLIQFGIKVLLNKQIKEQIISLKLLKKNMSDAAQTFLSFVSLDELSQLRSLTLDDLDGGTISQISSMLPLLAKLRYFHITKFSFGFDEMLNSLSTSTIQTLLIPRLTEDLILTHAFTSLINLIIERCSVADLCHFFKHSPKLYSLNIERLYDNRLKIDRLRLSDNHAIHLKRLVIHQFRGDFDFLEILLKRTPNLKFLMICDNYDSGLVDAGRWQRLITTSLPVLDVFKFKFRIEFENEDSDILDKFHQFQSGFWHQQHQWHIECTYNKYDALIYTVPYISNEYKITQYTKRHYNESINNMNTFAKVTDLTLHLNAIINPYQYYFSNVRSLKLKNVRADENDAYPFFKSKHIQCLKTTLDLCRLTHVDISSECRLKSPSVMLQLLRKAPYISSLTINKDTLFSLLNNHQLCECLNKMIKKLELVGLFHSAFLNSNEIVKLCQTFSMMEEFRCDIEQLENLKLMLNHLSKLSHMKAFFYVANYFGAGHYWLTDHVPELNLLSFKVKCENYSCDDDDDDDYDYSDYDID